jgi:hypothetical protein
LPWEERETETEAKTETEIARDRVRESQRKRDRKKRKTQSSHLGLFCFSWVSAGVAVSNCVLECVSLIKFNTLEQLNLK